MKRSFQIVFFALILCLFTMSLSARSVYVIGNRYVVPNFPLLSFDIQPSALNYQEQLTIPNHGFGAYEITADEENKIIFVTFKNDATVELVDGKLLTSAGYTSLDGITNPTGTVFSQNQKYLVLLQQNTNQLYVYAWDNIDKSFSPLFEDPYYHELSGVSSGLDIAIDDEYGILYVADSSQFDIHSYYLDTWDDAGCTTLPQKPTIIALDEARGFMYSSDENYGAKVIQFNLNSGSSKSYSIDTDAKVMDITVDENTGNIYITLNYTSGINKMIVLDQDLELYVTVDENIEHPSGVYIPVADFGYNPFDIKIKDDIHTWVKPGGKVLYTISYSNLLNYGLENVVLKSYLSPKDETSFVTCSNGGDYSTTENTITWNLGTVEAGAEVQEVNFTLLVDNSLEDLSTLLNQVVISSGALSTTKEIYTLVRSKNPVNSGYFSPNPYNPQLDEIGTFYPNFTHEDALITSMIIFDESGEKVREQKNISYSDIHWNGRNESGVIVENGVYFVVIKNAEGEKNIVKVAILR